MTTAGAEHSAHTIAVVEDDEDILANVCRFLQKSGFRVWGASSAEDFYVHLLRDKADLVVVDLGLPGESGLSLVQRLAAQRIPVVVQTALGDLEHRIAGLEAGALQYFVKPTDMNELVAGIRSQLRGAGAASQASGAGLARWRLEPAAAQLVAPNQLVVRLTSRELDFLRCLMATDGGLVSKQALLEAMGHDGVEDGFHRIESMLTRLRRKTLDTTGTPLPVRAVFGRGLVFIA
ncbi:response regulator transcription factor [Ottowia sp.]|uniref:response regulator transcription factor n=1 Tax=Ottowia sp. TaxID=1898956 RepID=UPI0039E6C70C